MCREEHVHPLIHAFQAEDLVIQLVPDFKDKIEVPPVSYRWLLLAGVLVRILRKPRNGETSMEAGLLFFRKTLQS
jgi:hypothetical protein